jgi:hypothetical protein
MSLDEPLVDFVSAVGKQFVDLNILSSDAIPFLACV